MTQPVKPFELFICYSHKDDNLRQQLVEHLSNLQRQGLIAGWHDRQIVAGKNWANEIDEHLNSSKIILLLVSSSFIASNYCYDIEMKRAIERHELGEAVVIPIILRASHWANTPFSKLQSLPKDGKAITSWSNRDEAFANVVEGICRTIEQLNALSTHSSAGKKVLSKENEPATTPEVIRRQVDVDLNAISSAGTRGNAGPGDDKNLVLRSMLIGVSITVALIITQLVLERYVIGFGNTLRGYEWLQSVLKPLRQMRNPSVIVVDISKLPGGHSEQVKTDSSKLLEIIKAIADYQPQAIAVDIDFSPPDSGPEAGQTSAADRQFFDECLFLSNNIRLYLGVYRHIASSSDLWLGDEKYKKLAAGVPGDKFGVTRVPIWFQLQDEPNRLPSLSWAAAGSRANYQINLPAWAVQSVSIQRPAPRFEYADMLVDYANLEEIGKGIIQAKTGNPIREAQRERFRDRIVIIGDGTKSSEQFVPPGRNKPWPGVYLHACAADTFVRSPIIELRLFVRFAFDVLLAVVTFAPLAFFRSRHTDKKGRLYHILSSEKSIFTVSVALFIGGSLFAVLLSLLWLDFIAIAVAIPLSFVALRKKEEG